MISVEEDRHTGLNVDFVGNAISSFRCLRISARRHAIHVYACAGPTRKTREARSRLMLSQLRLSGFREPHV